MKKLIPLFIFSLFVLTDGVFAQTSVQTNSRRDCSFIGRPIIDIGGGIIIGKAIKIRRPRLNEVAKRFAQNAVVNVKIEINENGKVISAKADGEIPILQNLSEQAARQTKFTPSSVNNIPIKVSGKIIYKFNQGKIAISYSFEPIENNPTPIDPDGFKFARMFDSKIVSAIYDFRAKKSLESYAFIKNDRANIQLCLMTKTPEIIEKFKQTGFELLEETKGNGLVGQISVENLEKLADIEEIHFIVPEMP